MILVLDTCAAVEIVLNRKHAAVLSKHLTNADWVITPYLYIPEVTNVFWKYYQFTDMPKEKCEEAIEQAVALPDEYFDEELLYREAFSLACLSSRPVYDMYFLILARRNNGFLLTLDSSLLETAKKNSIKTL